MKSALTVLLLSTALWGQVYSSGGPVVNNVGQPVAAQIAVCTTQPPLPNPPTTNPPNCSAYAPTYSDATLATPCSLNPSTLGPLSGVSCTNPGKTDSRGNYTVYAASTVYYAEIYGYGIQTYLMPFSTASTAAGNFASPPPIGNVTPNTGQFTILQGEADAKNYASLGAACAASAAVYVPAGTITPAAQITCPQPTRFRGAGVGVTIIQPTVALAAVLFSATAAGEGWGWSDMTIDMTNVPTIGVWSWSGITRPITNNVRVIYPTGGTGTLIYKTNSGEAHVTNLMAKNPGVCVDIQGDSGQEDFWTDISCESPSTAGYRISRTTTTDVGGQYLLRFKVTNPYGAASGSGFIITSTTINTYEPWWCFNCVADSQGGNSLSANNVVGLYSSGSWYRTSTGGGVLLNNITEYVSSQDNMQGATCDLKFTGADTTVHISGSPVFSGATANVCVGTATLSGVSIINPIYTAAPPMTAADNTALAAAWPTSTGFFSGGAYLRANNTVGPAMFGLYTDVTGAANPNKWFTITSAGNLIIRNSANNAPIFDLDDTGIVTLKGTLQLGTNQILQGATTVIDSSDNGNFASVKIGTTNHAPVVAAPTVGQAACIYAAGPPVQIGKCTTVVSSGGACTCAP